MTGKQNAREIEERFEKLLLPVLEENGYDLIKAEYAFEESYWYLRGFIKRKDEADVSIGDCTLVSRIVSKKLDKEDFIDDEYTLEICSKGFLEPPQTEEDNINRGSSSQQLIFQEDARK